MKQVIIDETAFDDPGRDLELLARAGLDGRVGSIDGVPDPGVAALLVGNTPVDDMVVERYPCLRVVSRYGTGTDNIRLTKRSARIEVRNVDGYATEAVATHALGLIIAGARLFRDMDNTVRNRSAWKRPVRPIPGMDVQTLGIVGYGRIGSRVAHLAERLFGRVTVFDPYVKAVSQGHVRVNRLVDLLLESDIVTIHVPLTEETTSMIGAAELKLIGVDGVLVNTARGRVVDVEAVADALGAGNLRACALDVLPDEQPAAVSRILLAPRTILTPHVGWMTIDAEAAMRDGAIQNVVDVLLNSGRRV